MRLSQQEMSAEPTVQVVMDLEPNRSLSPHVETHSEVVETENINDHFVRITLTIKFLPYIF